jgi:hypothetical protein
MEQLKSNFSPSSSTTVTAKIYLKLPLAHAPTKNRFSPFSSTTVTAASSAIEQMIKFYRT